MKQETRKVTYLLLLLLVAPVFVCAQSTTPVPNSSSQETAQPGAVLKVTTRLVLVDVVVLDKKGLPITNLNAEDFNLQEEGTAQKVRIFNFQQPSQGEQLPMEAATLPAKTFSNVPTFKSNKTLSVLLLDGLNTDMTSQKFVRQELLKLLEKLPTGQPVAVYALGSKLHLLQDFTTDPALLKQAVVSMKGRNSGVMTNAAGTQDPAYLSGASSSALLEMGLQSMLTQIQLFQQDNIAAQTDLRVDLTLTAIKSLARTLSGYPGRKNLIWVSSAFPADLLTPTQLANAAIMQGHSPWLRSYSDEIERASNALSNARVAVYPVDARTLVNSNVYSSLSNTDSNGNYLGRTASGRPGGSAGGLGAELDRTSDDLLAAHTTMNSVAEMTGGKAFYGRNDLDKGIREGLEDGETYYTLGYYPENKDWDGKFRKIVVTVNQSGAKLRYRQGYFAIDPKGYQKLAARQQAIDLGQALSLDVPVATALTFQAAAAPVSDTSGNKVLIRFGIDAHPLGFDLQDDGLEHASVDCAAQAYTLKGEPVQARASTFAVGLKPEQFQLVMQRFLPCNQSLELGPGDYLLRLGVRDNATGLIGTANARVTVPTVAAATGPAQQKP